LRKTVFEASRIKNNFLQGFGRFVKVIKRAGTHRMQAAQQSNTINNRVYWGKNRNILSNVQLTKQDLTRLQKESYQRFLTEGIGELLNEISPVTDFTGKNCTLEFGLRQEK
jgi:DNA-directed RNA polymerase beta subunit